jgi:hypothetical protein
VINTKQVQGAARRGFSLTATAYSTGCGGVFHGMRGNISSPIDNDGSNKYPNGAECIWDIVGEPGFHVELSFYGRFDIEDTFGCTNDYLMVSKPFLLNVENRTKLH